MSRQARYLSGIVTLCILACGCQNQAPPATNAPPPKVAPAITTEDSKEQQTTPEPVKPAEPDSPPVAAVRKVLEEVDAGRLEAIAEFLPASYQHDLEKLFRTLADKTPDDLWAQLHEVATKAASLLEQQPRLIAEAAGEPPPKDEAEFREKLSAALAPLTNAETWERSRWQSFELAPFLKGPVSAMLAAWQTVASSPAALSAQTTVKLVKLDGDHATLELRSAVDPEPRTVEFVEIEEKWIPKSLAESWPSTIGRAVSQLSEVTDAQSNAVASRITPVLLQVGAILDQMRDAERPEELQLGWWQIQSLVLQARQQWVEPGPAPRIEIRVAGPLADQELTDLLEQLTALVDQPDLAEYVTFPTTTGTSIQLSPVKDFADFLKQLNFVTIKSQDADARLVEIELLKRGK